MNEDERLAHTPISQNNETFLFYRYKRKPSMTMVSFCLSLHKSILYVSSLFFYFDIGKSHFEGRSLPQFAIDFDFTFVEANQLFHYR